ncbi:MAG: LapA family protein [Chitinophagaceae bacterium]|nr:MAG: LapA family protein [Chitinophagaceae bacterium]
MKEEVKPERNRRKENIYLIGGLVLLVLIIIITVQNTDPAEVKLLFWRFEFPLIIILLAMFLFGFIYGQIKSFFSNRQIEREIKARDKLIKDLRMAQSKSGVSNQQSDTNKKDDNNRGSAYKY